MDKIGTHMLRIATKEAIKDRLGRSDHLAGGYKIGRNDKCICGSQKKFKKCCEPKINEAADKAAQEHDDGE